ncbi:glutamate-cysteine ligase family protein [Roseimaritima sediminicola]|uniref:glutamate-cysteine ligase family protein n=1 Tax=Roseimaritima sediminicola TaxID=2662066 RepID=UPI00129833B7|nr:glutamate-cysteine ligase family protein [Roseimaritima sediminicola]
MPSSDTYCDPSAYALFDVHGVELEYMLVDRQSLDVRPWADRVLEQLAGDGACDAVCGPVTWSNELAAHVLECKTTDPAKDLRSVGPWFREALGNLQPILDQYQLQLLPTAMHPWMDAARETCLWPHAGHDIYRAYDRIFNCHTPGWSNVQSVHLNLPFRGDDQFARLHAAVRILLPLLPALAASSPVLEGRVRSTADTRMRLYADHCREVPSLTGQVIPEAIFDQARYEAEILGPIAAALRLRDPQEVLQVEFANARGAIARFDRGSIEIRVMDVQEYPSADLALCAAAAATARALCDQRWSDTAAQQAASTASLRRLLDQTTTEAEAAVIDDAAFLNLFGITQPEITAADLWAELLGRLRKQDATLEALISPLQIILHHGSLATRIRYALGAEPTREKLREVYRRLGDCLVHDQPLLP